jgi:hypothetical protein
MDRLATYLRLFAELLGTENEPVFKGIKNASTGLKAKVPEVRNANVRQRLVLVRTDPSSRPAKTAATLEEEMGADGIRDAQLLDSHEGVIHLFHGAVPVPEDHPRIYQEGSVDGVVTGLVGADDTMHLHLRGLHGRDFRLVVRDEGMARDILAHFRNGLLRLFVQGHWTRSDDGWHPEASRCTVKSFVELDCMPLGEVLKELSTVPDNGWEQMEHPEAVWREIRGIH